MQDINKCIKETDTDNVTLKKLKELGTKLTGQENVQGETIADVIGFINDNYSGGGSSGGSSELPMYYAKSDSTNVYVDEECTTKLPYDDAVNISKTGATIKLKFANGHNYCNVIAINPAEMLIDEGKTYYQASLTIYNGTENIEVKSDLSVAQ